MKPAEAKRLAKLHSADELQAAAEKLSEETRPVLEVNGDFPGEQLTHVLLAMRIRQRVDEGEELKTAFRSVMGEVRGVLSND